jgi:putative cardiolipin synthase
MTNRLIAAADRGVSVRLLVDDIKLHRSTYTVASLCLHPNIEIRVFNPWRARSSKSARGMEFFLRFRKLDHRMHNKLLIADNDRAIFGGRNIAEEYFGLNERYNFIDFDVLHEGRAVDRLSSAFEAYWTSPAAIPGTELNDSVSAADLEATRARLAKELAQRTPALSTVLAEERSWADRMASLSRPAAEGVVNITVDSPDFSGGAQPTQVYQTLRKAFDNAEHDLVVMVPFFVPSDVEWYRGVVDRGVRLRVLTNSLASNPVTISNSGLSQQRAGIVNAGVELHELRTDAAAKSEWETLPRVGRILSMHKKLYVIDRKRVFFGSVNLDPRSKFINTEMAVSVEDSDFAAERADEILRLMEPDNAWRVETGPDGRLEWHSDTQILRRQPAMSWRQRVSDSVFARFPIRNQV